MVFKTGIRLPFDKMIPAYDLEFHPSAMSFRAPGAPRLGGPGTTVFTVYDTHKVIYHEDHDTEVKFTFVCLPSEYEKLQKIYFSQR